MLKPWNVLSWFWWETAQWVSAPTSLLLNHHFTWFIVISKIFIISALHHWSYNPVLYSTVQRDRNSSESEEQRRNAWKSVKHRIKSLLSKSVWDDRLKRKMLTNSYAASLRCLHSSLALSLVIGIFRHFAVSCCSCWMQNTGRLIVLSLLLCTEHGTQTQLALLTSL